MHCSRVRRPRLFAVVSIAAMRQAPWRCLLARRACIKALSSCQSPPSSPSRFSPLPADKVKEEIFALSKKPEWRGAAAADALPRGGRHGRQPPS